MHAIISLLDQRHHEEVVQIWRLLQKECGLSGVLITPIPHFSWQVSAGYDFERLESVLAEIAMGAKPFYVRDAGLGIFTGDQDIVLFISLQKGETLLKMHHKIWHASLPYSISPERHYAPENWVPHITLGHRDIDEDGLACAVRMLARKHIDWHIKIDNLALVYQDEGQIGRQKRQFKFSGT